MSDDARPTTPPADQPNKAQAEFERYKARLGGMQAAMIVPWGMPPGGVPGWPSPQPGAPMQAAAPGPAAPGARSIGDQLSETVRLGIDLVNAVLGGGARVVAGGAGLAGAWPAMVQAPSWGGGSWGHGHGCGCQSCCPPTCACPSCCDPCCSPGVRNCC
ncbi:MAG: hypothetical protein K2X49_15200 [Acetobacteraceae bacterium]|nr:hypothetical protein [Acetobacteraceae bacterium]